MKDFKNPNLFKLEQGTFETFVDSMLETNTEYNHSGRLRTGLVEEEEESTEMFGSIDDWGSAGGMDDFNFDFSSGLDSYSSDSSDKLLNPRGYTVEEMGTLQMLMTAPLHAMRQTADAVINTKKVNQETRKQIAKDWRVWGLTLGGFSVLGLFPFVTSFIYLPVGIGMFATAGLADYYYGKKGGNSLILGLINGDEDDFESGEAEPEEEDTEEDFGGSGLDSGLSDFGGFGGFPDFGGLDDKDNTFNDRYSDFVDDEGGSSPKEDEYYDPETMGSKATDYFPESPIETNTTAEFREGLVDVYKSGLSTQGKMLYSREDMVKYYARYMPNNDKAFARWTTIREHSPEYDNLAYTIYKSLVSVNGKFDMRHAVPAGEKLTVMEMKRTPLIFKITVKLPSYFKMNDITTRATVFNDMLKASDDDEKVGTILTTYGGDLVIKFLRLDYKKLVAMGDLLRLSNDDSSESFAEQFSTSKGIPMVAGMRDNEYPYMVDIVGNPAASVVGGSGSGKSWLTFQFMDSMLIANNPEQLNFLILDAKDASIWKQFALAPHVVGYHSDYHDFIDILMEVKAEHERRMKELSRLGIESWKDYTDRYKRSGDTAKVAEMPLLFVIIDEITYTMSSLQNEDIDQYKELKNILTQLSSVIRASGIRLMLIGQRAIDTSIPKGFMANSPLKLSMKMNVQSDFTTMLGKGYDREVSRIPSGPGEGIMLAEGQTKPSYVKTVIPGGTSDGDILMQVRVMALDWVRRTQGTNYDYTTLYNDMRTTIKKGFNRNLYYNQALTAVQEGRITDPVTPDEGYLLSVNSPNANLFENAMENVERKLGKSEEPETKEEVRVNEPLEELVPELEEFDWGSLLEEPDDVEVPYEEESPPYEEEMYMEDDTYGRDLGNFGGEENTEVADNASEEINIEEYEMTEAVVGQPETSDFYMGDVEEQPEEELVTVNGWESTEEVVELEIEEYEPELPEPELPEVEEPKHVEQKWETVEDTYDLSLDDLLAEESEGVTKSTETSKGNADVGDISTMLDIATETLNKQEVPYEETEEYLQFKKEQEELEETRRKQQEMLDKLQQQQEEHRKAQELRLQEEKRKKELEEQAKREQERKAKVAEEQRRLQAQKAELEKQKQEILRLQEELSKSRQEKEVVEPKKPLKGVTPEPRVVKVVKEEEPAKVEEKPQVKPKQPVVSKPKEVKVGNEGLVQKKEPIKTSTPEAVAKPKAKPVKRKKVDDSIKKVQPNTVNYNEMENMSVSQYIAKFGEVVDGNRRIETQVIKAKFNRRKVSLSIAVGEVYEEGEYFYYIG